MQNDLDPSCACRACDEPMKLIRRLPQDRRSTRIAGFLLSRLQWSRQHELAPELFAKHGRAEL